MNWFVSALLLPLLVVSGSFFFDMTRFVCVCFRYSLLLSSPPTLLEELGVGEHSAIDGERGGVLYE